MAFKQAQKSGFDRAELLTNHNSDASLPALPMRFPGCIPTYQHFGHPAYQVLPQNLYAHLRAVGSSVLQILTGLAVPKLPFIRAYTERDSVEKLSPLP